jgi:hypothetical protein
MSFGEPAWYKKLTPVESKIVGLESSTKLRNGKKTLTWLASRSGLGLGANLGVWLLARSEAEPPALGVLESI